MKFGLGVFAKTIGLSPVKTRLARDIGPANAQAFYRLSVAAVAETVDTLARGGQRDVHPYWAVAEAGAVSLAQWRAFPALWTGHGPLGERLNAVYSALARSHDGVILMGTDSPQLTPAAITQAIERLERRPDCCVIGPALDGGFYLFAAGIALAAECWTQVRYSAATTRDELVSGIEAHGGRVVALPARTDTDSVADLERLRAELTGLASPTRSQRRLIDWLAAFAP